MSIGFELPSASTRTHWWFQLYLWLSYGVPSTSMILDVDAVSLSPTNAVPVMSGWPVAGLFAGTLMYSVRVVSPDQSRFPSIHLK